MEIIPRGAKVIGYLWLVDNYDLVVIPHFRWSYIIEQGARRVLYKNIPKIYLYDKGYELGDPKDPIQNLIFAIKHEGLNLEIILAFLKCIEYEKIYEYVSNMPTGKYQRIVWYLYENFFGKKLDISDIQQGSYINLLDSEEYYTANPIAQSRYRINDNLLGNVHFCPFVRRTDFLKKMESKKLNLVANDILKKYDQRIIDRASTYLYVQETMSSYKIERETPSKQRLAKFIRLVKKVEEVPSLTKEVLIQLQNNIVDERFIDKSYRETQNYIGQSRDLFSQIIHYISPKPEDVNELMSGLFLSLQRMLESGVHSFAIVAAISFGFVFIHPFEDGNGRLHRFLIHYILHKLGFTPRGMIFPVSAIILSDMEGYDKVLESHSRPLMSLISDYDVDDDGILDVYKNNASFYKYIDYTLQAEYLALCIDKTIHTDFKKELDYLINYDKTKEKLAKVVDMPDRFINLFIKFIEQGDGKLSETKRIKYFSKLTKDEIEKMESLVTEILL